MAGKEETVEAMNNLVNAIAEFTLGTSIWVYLFIFFGKIVEVTFGTLRIVLINRGIRVAGTVIAFIEIMLWLIIASSVLAGFQEDFLKGVIYALAFALGNYAGSWLDELLAFGLCSMQVIITDETQARVVVEALRSRGFGVTTMDVHGRLEDHFMLLMTMKRRRCGEASHLIEELCPHAVISTSDIKSQRGSYLEHRGRTGSFRIGK